MNAPLHFEKLCTMNSHSLPGSCASSISGSIRAFRHSGRQNVSQSAAVGRAEPGMRFNWIGSRECSVWNLNWGWRFQSGGSGSCLRSSTARADTQSLEEAAAPQSSNGWEASPPSPSSSSSQSNSWEASSPSTSSSTSSQSSSVAAAAPDSSIVGELSGGDRTRNDFITSSSNSLQVESPQLATKGGVFPGGVRRREVRIPGMVLRINGTDVLLNGKTSEGFLGALSSAVAGGLTMVILESSGGEGEGGARLYEAACALKSVLRGRAELLIAERVDIAAAAGADGVLLSDEGLPAVVARRMMQSAGSDSVVLPMVARTVSSTQSARSATALEGADLLLLQCSDVQDLGNFVNNVVNEVSIPVFLDVSGLRTSSKDMGLSPTLDLLQGGASGLVFSAKEVMDNEDVCKYVAGIYTALNLAMQQWNNIDEIQSGQGSSDNVLEQGTLAIVENKTELFLDLDLQAKLILEEERKLLTAMVDFVQAASPEMEEISLLVDAVKQLDELFLLVIVGEFNSGKSSVINALLGGRFLKEGVLPTTNEITILRHSGDGSEGGERSEKHPDGHFTRYIPAELLKQMNLVDTPGTNVILQRQQRLTEEFVPRADLVLFVLSVDRPLTESEVTFLRYIRQWGKKIVFILNKSDVVSERAELEEVVSFVRENAQSLLSVEQALVFPVSARRAILAKETAMNEDGVIDEKLLLQETSWKSSGFGELQEFIYSFLGGSSDAGAERLRLKLETPLGIGMALLGASDRKLSADLVKADTELRVLAQIDDQINQYQQAMEADTTLQQQRVTEVIIEAKGRAGKFVDSILRLSNVETMLKFLLSSDGVRSTPVSRGFDKQVIGSAISDVRGILQEHASSLVSNTTRQMNMYGELVRSRWQDVVPLSIVDTEDGSQPSPLLESSREKQQESDSKSIAVLEGFDIQAAELLLGQEIREVVLGTFGGFGVAGLSASVLTSILPNTLEDLLALGVCTAGGYVGVSNLPSRRRDVKNKVNKVADGIARQLCQAMQVELEQNFDQLREEMKLLTTPYRIAAEAERARIIALQSELEALDSELRALRQKVQNLGT